MVCGRIDLGVSLGVIECDGFFKSHVDNTVTELKLRVEWVREGNDIGLALVSLFEDHSFSISLVACS